ncbi:unnamed protein product [Sympodiomycopsis kandeliae]
MATTSQTPRVLYRSLLKELRANPTNPIKVINTSAFESQPIVQHVKSTFRNTSSIDAQIKEMRDLETYLRSNRVHKQLLLRYNPMHDQTEKERVRATARRVGLDVPKEYVPGKQQEQAATASSKVSSLSKEAQELNDILTGRTGPLPPPDLDTDNNGR